ncbi:MAG TPA: (d)CMP kinase [Chloroflexota bacterium]|nr:(d)CMP kinase [Chloroflexota bacterium]
MRALTARPGREGSTRTIGDRPNARTRGILPPTQSSPMRLGRALSVLGFCSRREAERQIGQGRVAVDGHTVTDPAHLVALDAAKISVDGHVISAPQERTYLAAYKPIGVTTTMRDPHAARTIAELAPGHGRLFPVGRLDRDSEGLILLTNDGVFANFVAHPRYRVEREYVAMIDRALTDRDLRRLRRGIVIDGQPVVPAAVEIAAPDALPTGERGRAREHWVRVVLREGRNREVRRLLASAGVGVSRLVRVRIGPVRLAGLRPGQYRPLRRQEIAQLSRGYARGVERRALRSGPRRAESPGFDPGDTARLVVAIDGPAASGKSTVGQAVARRLGATFLDTGLLYRAVTLVALEGGVPPSDERALAELARSLKVRVAERGAGTEAATVVFIDERDVTNALRSPDVDAHVSTVAAHEQVRAALIPVQRRAAEARRIVAVGRDIGTVIFPDAAVKVFLDASEHERARRRALESTGVASSEAVRAEIARRDETDRSRAVAPLRPAPDATVIQTDGLTIEDVTDRIVDLVAAAERDRA